MTYWQVGQRLVEHEQGSAERADYGIGLLKPLSRDFEGRLGRGFSEKPWSKCGRFYLQWPISHTASAKLAARVQSPPFPRCSHWINSPLLEPSCPTQLTAPSCIEKLVARTPAALPKYKATDG
jgi:hypothetical protein